MFLHAYRVGVNVFNAIANNEICWLFNCVQNGHFLSHSLKQHIETMCVCVCVMCTLCMSSLVNSTWALFKS